MLLVLDGAAGLRGLAGLPALLADGPAYGIVTVALADQVAGLPAECRATAVLGGSVLGGSALGGSALGGSALALSVDGQPPLTGVLPDGVPAGEAERAARALAPLRDLTRDRDAGLPAGARWTEAVGLPLDGGAEDAERLLARWAARSRSTAVTLGPGPDGPYVVDLAADGPHALVAGTTGSGKSELLQTLVASLAADNRPDDLHLVLVDYKGGAAFGPCARLPHTVGVVTDLDGALVERALASLTAELTRRERVLAAAGATDLAALRRGGRSLPRLVLVVDEFAALVEELPDFVRGLVGIAQRGRSLGVHLVLATQRPEGVVSADIRANTALRICLAVTRDTESRDVLDDPVAATIGRDTPGRAYARTGHGRLTAFQTARVGGVRPAPTPAAPQVELLPLAELGDPPPAAPEPPEAPPDRPATASDLDLLVAAGQEAARRLQLPPPTPPWLPPLPPAVSLEELPPGPADLLAFGLLDRPQEQARHAFGLRLGGGHLMLVGGPRSGRTTGLLALAGAVATRAAADDVHVHAVDCGGGLAPLAELPHAGAVVPREQPERMARLLDRLAAEVDRRQALLAAAGCAGVAEQRAAADPAGRLPYLLLLLDRWEAFVATFTDREAGRLVDVAYRLLREGPGVGLQVVLTGDRSGLVGRVGTMVEDRLLLRLPDPGDYAVAGLPPRLAGVGLPPGRGWLPGPAPEAVQLCLLGEQPTGAAQAAALAVLAAGAAPPARHRPLRVDALPARVDLADLPAAPGRPALGVGGDELAPVGPDLTDGGFLVAGPPRSGRSAALLTLAAQLPLPLVALCPRPSPLRELPGADLADLADPEALQARLDAGPVALLVDDAELLVDGPLGPVLERAVRTARDRGGVVLAAGSTDALTAAYRGFPVELRRLGHGLLLSPRTAADGDLFGLRLPPPEPPQAGRGLLVRAGTVLPVQVARVAEPAFARRPVRGSGG